MFLPLMTSYPQTSEKSETIPTLKACQMFSGIACHIVHVVILSHATLLHFPSQSTSLNADRSIIAFYEDCKVIQASPDVRNDPRALIPGKATRGPRSTDSAVGLHLIQQLEAYDGVHFCH